MQSVHQEQQGSHTTEQQVPTTRAAFLLTGTADYKPPHWACLPFAGNAHARLEAYRDTKQCATFVVATKKVNIFGRDQTACDHVLSNPSISRKHAAIIHDKNGGIHIVDLMSRHGTYVGGKKLPTYDPYLLHEGDTVKFGQSTKVYVLKGAAPDGLSAGMKKPWVKLRRPRVSAISAVLPKLPSKPKRKCSSEMVKLVNDVCYGNVNEEKLIVFINTVMELGDENEKMQDIADTLIERFQAKYEFYAAHVHGNAYTAITELLKKNLCVEQFESNLSIITQISQQRSTSIYRTNARKLLKLIAAVRLDPDNVDTSWMSSDAVEESSGANDLEGENEHNRSDDGENQYHHKVQATNSYSNEGDVTHDAPQDQYASNYEPPSSSYEPPSSNYQPPNSRYEPPSTNYQPPSSNYQPPSANYKPPSSDMNNHDAYVPTSFGNHSNNGYTAPTLHTTQVEQFGESRNQVREIESSNDSHYSPPNLGSNGLSHVTNEHEENSRYEPPSAQYAPPTLEPASSSSGFQFMANYRTEEQTEENAYSPPQMPNTSVFSISEKLQISPASTTGGPGEDHDGFSNVNKRDLDDFVGKLGDEALLRGEDFEELWGSTDESIEWSTNLSPTFNINALQHLLQQSRIQYLTSDRISGVLKQYYYAEEKIQGTWFLVEVLVVPGLLELTATVKWVVSSLLYNNDHEIFLSLFKSVVASIEAENYEIQSLAQELSPTYSQSQDDFSPRDRQISDETTDDVNFHEDERSDTDIAQSEDDDEEEDEEEVDDGDFSVRDYLTESPNIDPAKFEQLWASATEIGSLSYSLQEIPDQGEIVEKFAANCLGCLASGMVDHDYKFFFFGEMVELHSLVCLELVIDTRTGEVSGSVKRYASQRLSEEEEELIDESLLLYVERIL